MSHNIVESVYILRIWLQKILTIRDVNRSRRRRRRLKSSRQIDVDGTAVRRCPLWPGVWGPHKAPRSSGINGAKSCILSLSWHLISLLKLHFFALFFSYFQQLFKIKDPFLLLLIILWQWFRHFNLLTTKMY